MVSSNFVVRVEAPNTATRPNGATAREKLREVLRSVTPVVVDLEQVVLTPSFADEFLGVLLAELGEEEFRRSVVIKNVAAVSRPLLQTVFQRRIANPRPASKFAAQA